jgi:putative transposase
VYSGSLKTLFELLTANPQLGEVRRVLIDSTIVRAHAHAAGARRKKKRSVRPARRASRPSVGAGAG